MGVKKRSLELEERRRETGKGTGEMGFIYCYLAHEERSYCSIETSRKASFAIVKERTIEIGGSG